VTSVSTFLVIKT